MTLAGWELPACGNRDKTMLIFLRFSPNFRAYSTGAHLLRAVIALMLIPH
jgi:hypothetical protein